MCACRSLATRRRRWRKCSRCVLQATMAIRVRRHDGFATLTFSAVATLPAATAQIVTPSAKPPAKTKAPPLAWRHWWRESWSTCASRPPTGLELRTGSAVICSHTLARRLPRQRFWSLSKYSVKPATSSATTKAKSFTTWTQRECGSTTEPQSRGGIAVVVRRTGSAVALNR